MSWTGWPPASEAPVRLLRRAGLPAVARGLQGTLEAPPDQRGGLYETALTALGCLESEAVLRYVTPPHTWLTPPRVNPIVEFDGAGDGRRPRRARGVLTFVVATFVRGVPALAAELSTSVATIVNWRNPGHPLDDACIRLGFKAQAFNAGSTKGVRQLDRHGRVVEGKDGGTPLFDNIRSQVTTTVRGDAHRRPAAA
jgi:hypothetical protein